MTQFRTRIGMMIAALWMSLSGITGGAMAGQLHLDEPIQPLPRTMALDAAKVALGGRLFADPRLSRDNTVSCSSCHSFELGGADGLERSFGIEGRQVAFNAPTVFNSAFSIAQFWDGRALTLEEQMDGPVHDRAEMDSSWPEITAKLRRDKQYTSAFKAIYGGLIAERTIKDAIATFERSLITPDAPFDRYLRGEDGAISAAALEGYRLFKSYGCIACHQGMNVGGNMFQRFGVMDREEDDRPGAAAMDLGRAKVTGRDRDKHVFKVPSLRNVAATAPYFHDGSAETLESAIVVMAKVQLGRLLSGEETASIAAFLRSLTGDYQGKPVWPR